jgi:hypothetical protein
MLATTSDADVERAVAAFGAPSMPYRTFRVEPPTPNAAAPSQSTAVAFPLLAAALPETAGGPAPAPLPASVTATATPVADTPSPPHGAEAWPLPEATSLPPEPAAAIPADQGRPWRGTEVRQAAHEQAVRSTPLASVFRMLRGEPIRRDHPPEPRPGLLQDVFRRL